MTRSGTIGKRALVFLGLTLAVLAAPLNAAAQERADPLKLTSSKPVMMAWVIKADKTADFEAAWAGMRALLAKSGKADLMAFSETLTQVFKVEQAPFDAKTPQGETVKAVMYIVRIDAPSTTFSYDPREILYTYLKPGQEGSAVTRAEVDDIYTGKLTPAFVQISFLWTLTKIG